MRKTLVIIAAIAFCLTGFTSCRQQDETKAKYVFLFIGDGMGATHVATAESYLSHKAGKLGGEQLLMTTFQY